MRWPDIFFKAKPTKEAEKTEPPAPTPTPEAPEAAAEAAPAPAPIASPVATTPEPAPGPLPSRLPVTRVKIPPAPVEFSSGDVTVAKDMADADTLRTMTRSGGIRLVKRDFPPPAPFPPPIIGHGKVSPVAPPPSISMDSVAKEAAAPGSPAPSQRPSINLWGTQDQPAPTVVHPPGITFSRRRTKIADVARIVLPPRRDDAASTPENETSATVIPPSFSVPISTGSAMQATPAPALDLPSVEAPSQSVMVPPPSSETTTAPSPSSADATPMIEQEKPSEAPTDPIKKEDDAAAQEKSEPPPPEPQASHPPAEPAAETSKPEPAPAPLSPSQKKREFVLSNGERILGHILSETPDAIYIDHGTLGVLTIPRTQIAQRPIEIILINGDRIVGDVVAETSDALLVRHASLGILTVPHNQRSTRVVEAILKDGDRILGEVLGETENFTVIRSATLGTVAVPHNRVAMLNRRAEQVQMKALPPASQLENKPADSP
jgi:RNase P/RNase MRP subunit p29